MKIILISIGTRGDMEPFLSIGRLLKERGHRVICAFPEQFRDIVEEEGLEFASLGTSFIDLLNSSYGQEAMGGSGFGLKKFLAYIHLARHQTEINKELVTKQYDLIEREKPDRIVYNGKATYPILWAFKNRGKTIFISPVPYVHYTRGHAHVVFNRDMGPFFNKLSFLLVQFGMVTTLMISQKWLKTTEKIRRDEIKTIIKNTRSIYTISPTLFTRPDDWNDNIKILGYPPGRKDNTWQPPASLAEFLRTHKKIVFITFGSMMNPTPGAKTKILLDILERNKIPAIINTAAGGLLRPDEYDRELIYFASHLPYQHILPKIYAVIHHGGSGTTHLALKYGCPSMVIPHIIDQFVWNKIIYKKGLGPKGIKAGKITVKNLEPRILDLMNHQPYRTRAQQIAIQMSKEAFEEEICKTILA